MVFFILIIISAYYMNNLASQLANNKSEETREYMKKVLKAQNLEMDTVVISGESFYAMTGFFKVIW